MLSGSSDSNKILLCGPSHCTLFAFFGISAYLLHNVPSSAWRFRPPGWGGINPYLSHSRIRCISNFLFHPRRPNLTWVHPTSVRGSTGHWKILAIIPIGHFWSRCLPSSLLDLYFPILVTGTNCNELGVCQESISHKQWTDTIRWRYNMI